MVRLTTYNYHVMSPNVNFNVLEILAHMNLHTPDLFNLSKYKGIFEEFYSLHTQNEIKITQGF